MFNDKRDPNYTEKRAHYKEMLALTAKMLTKQRRRVIAEIEKIERKAFGAEFWVDETDDMASILQAIFVAMAYQSAQTTVEVVGIGVDLGMTAEAALTWAESYSFELIGASTEPRRERYQRRFRSLLRHRGCSKGI